MGSCSARVRCGGGKNAKHKYIYRGINTCAGAMLLAGGEKLCKYGCIGFSDCVRVCPFDAVRMGKDNMPIVDASKCTACGKCITACPKNIISLEDIKQKYYVKCLSHDGIVFVKSACKSGCIACKICEKLSKGVFVVENNLSRVDYSKTNNDTPWEQCVEKCPTKCIVHNLIAELR